MSGVIQIYMLFIDIYSNFGNNTVNVSQQNAENR